MNIHPVAMPVFTTQGQYPNKAPRQTLTRPQLPTDRVLFGAASILDRQIFKALGNYLGVNMATLNADSEREFWQMFYLKVMFKPLARAVLIEKNGKANLYDGRVGMEDWTDTDTWVGLRQQQNIDNLTGIINGINMDATQAEAWIPAKLTTWFKTMESQHQDPNLIWRKRVDEKMQWDPLVAKDYSFTQIMNLLRTMDKKDLATRFDVAAPAPTCLIIDGVKL